MKLLDLTSVLSKEVRNEDIKWLDSIYDIFFIGVFFGMCVLNSLRVGKIIALFYLSFSFMYLVIKFADARILLLKEKDG